MVARGPHLAALQAHGLRVRSVKGDFAVPVDASDDPSTFGPCDVVLFCVKAYDTEAAAGRLAPVLGPDTAVVSLQNGVDNEDQIGAVVGADHVVGGAAFIFSTIAEPGVIAHTGGPARIVFGERDNRRSDRVENLLAACLEAGIDADIARDINAVLWTKFAFICAAAGMTSTVRLPLGDIRESPAAWAMFRDIVAEVVALARLEGVELGDGVVDQQVGFAAASAGRLVLVAAPRPDLRPPDGARRAARLGGPPRGPVRARRARVPRDLRRPRTVGAPQRRSLSDLGPGAPVVRSASLERSECRVHAATSTDPREPVEVAHEGPRLRSRGRRLDRGVLVAPVRVRAGGGGTGSLARRGRLQDRRQGRGPRGSAPDGPLRRGRGGRHRHAGRRAGRPRGQRRSAG